MKSEVVVYYGDDQLWHIQYLHEDGSRATYTPTILNKEKTMKPTRGTDPRVLSMQERGSFAANADDAEEVRRHVSFPDGASIQVVLTYEGLIVDTFDGEGVPSATFAQTYDELYDFVEKR